MLTPGSAFNGSVARARKFRNYRSVLQYRVRGQCRLCEIKRKMFSQTDILEFRECCEQRWDILGPFPDCEIKNISLFLLKTGQNLHTKVDAARCESSVRSRLIIL